MSDFKQVIVVRRDLKMSPGKMVAQGAHASLAAIINTGEVIDDSEGNDFLAIPLTETMKPWLMTGSFKKITCFVENEAELLALYDHAKKLGIITTLIVDNGLTEFKGIPTKTTIAVGPDSSDRIDLITGHLPTR